MPAKKTLASEGVHVLVRKLMKLSVNVLIV